MLFYFTGTGNSLYVAKQLEKKPVYTFMGLNVSEKNQDARYINEHVTLEEIIEANDQD